MVMPYHLHMPSYFLETFTEYPYFRNSLYDRIQQCGLFPPMFQGRIRNVAFGLCETETVDSPADSDHCLESS